MPRPDDIPGAPSPGAPGLPDPDPTSLEIDLLRGELYRLLDEVARADPADRERLVHVFEDAWLRFLVEVARPR